MAERPKGYIHHLTRHRMRVRVPARRRDGAYFANLQRNLSQVPYVERVDVNPATASVLVHTSENAAQLINLARDSDWLDLAEAVAEEVPSILESFGLKADVIESALKQMSGGRLDWRNASFLILILAALNQARRGNILHAPAATLLWYAARILQNSRAVEGAR